MERQSIYKEEYLTEEEENSEDEKYINLYIFISTKIKTNIALMNYLFEIGWYEKEDIILLNTDLIQHMYNLLDKKDQITMKKNYLRDIRKITNNYNFIFN
jgi:hypothetical protein